MLATVNSVRAEPGRKPAFCRLFWAGAALLLQFWTLIAAAGETDTFADRTRRAYEAARKTHRADPDNPEKAWQFGRACFHWADFSTTKEQRAGLAEEGIKACRAAVKARPRSAGAHYYLAMNLGQLARTRSLGALPLVEELEGSLLRARSLDAAFNHAGADRSLAMLYRDAPGWPISVGNKKKARNHFANAVKLVPDYPENRISQLESAIEWDDEDLLKAGFRETAAVLKKARKQLTGKDWEADWADWDRRWKQIRETAEKEFDLR